MSWGAWGKQLSTTDMVAQIQRTLSAGITTFDHADIYGDYTTEAQFGEAFQQSGVSREEIQLISKCGIQHVGSTRNNRVKHYNYTKDYIIWSVEASLKKLRTDYVDLMLLHRPSPLMHPEEISEAILFLKEQGKILDFGVSNFNSSQIEMISSHIPVCANQIEFSLTAHEAMYNGCLEYLSRENTIAMSWSPLGTVFKEDNETTRRIRKCLLYLRNKYNCTEAQMLLAWILKHPAKPYPVIGTTNEKRLLNAQEAVSIDLAIEDWFELLAASQGHSVP